MATSDFTILTGALNSATVARGPSHGFTTPNGGGSAVYGFNSLSTSPGVVGLYYAAANYIPMAKGGVVSAAIKRGVSAGLTGFAPFIFIGLGGTSVTDQGYMLGLADGSPSRIVLRKGALSGSLPDVPATAPPTQGVLRRSTATFDPDEWVHIKLEMVVNTNNDVVLNCYENDLTANTVDPNDPDPPVWTAIPGMTGFIDDALQVNSGSAPFTSGRVGFGFYSSDISRRAYVDAIAIARQL